MLFVIGTIVVAALVTVLAAWWLVRRSPGTTAARQVMLASLSFPAVAVLLFAIATAHTLLGSQVQEPGGTVGMVVFALVFFLVYALVIGVVVGIPTALVAVRALRNR